MKMKMKIEIKIEIKIKIKIKMKMKIEIKIKMKMKMKMKMIIEYEYLAKAGTINRNFVGKCSANSIWQATYALQLEIVSILLFLLQFCF